MEAAAPAGSLGQGRHRSPQVPKAVLAADDANFYHHSGVDPAAVFRAMFNQVAGRTQGGSTITEQLAKLNYTGGVSAVTDYPATSQTPSSCPSVNVAGPVTWLTAWTSIIIDRLPKKSCWGTWRSDWTVYFQSMEGSGLRYVSR